MSVSYGEFKKMVIDVGSLVALDEDEFNDYDQFAVIDHRSDEEEVVESISNLIQESLETFWEKDDLWINFDDEKHKLPLTLTRHDRYIAISSLAELLKDKYTFWLSEGNLDDDTHYLLVLTNDATKELETYHQDWLENKLVQLKIGYDYFNGIDIPYLGNENNNPDFQWESEQLDKGLHMLRTELVKEKLKELRSKKWWQFWKKANKQRQHRPAGWTR